MAPELDHIERRLSAVEKISAKNVAYLDAGEKRLDRFQTTLDTILAKLGESAICREKQTARIEQLSDKVELQAAAFRDIRDAMQAMQARLTEEMTLLHDGHLRICNGFHTQEDEAKLDTIISAHGG